jgi:hypothetical protein
MIVIVGSVSMTRTQGDRHLSLKQGYTARYRYIQRLKLPDEFFEPARRKLDDTPDLQ